MKKVIKKDLRKIARDHFEKIPNKVLLEIMPEMAIDLFHAEKSLRRARIINIVLAVLLIIDLLGFLIRLF